MAHNKIWSWLVMELSAHGGYDMSVLSNMDHQTANLISKYGCKQSKLNDQDFLVVFCGPFAPIVQGCAVLHTLNTIKDFQGTVIYVTCDYLLHFDPNVSRYGKLLTGWPQDAFSKNKRWRFALHASPEHHFKTPKSLEKFKAFPNLDYYLELPYLCMAGLDPKWKTRFTASSPRYKTLYCGAFRQDRVDFFTRYFCQPESSGFVVSSSGSAKFKSLSGFSSSICPPFSGRIWDAITSSWVQIIGTDKVDAHSSETPLPTRFWEAVSAYVPVFFDGDCEGWKCFDTMGIHPHFVNSAKELREVVGKMERNPKLREHLVDCQLELLENLSLYDRWDIEKWFA